MIRNRHRRGFQAVGADLVRARVRTGVYTGEQLQRAQEWLEEVDQTAARQSLSAQQDQAMAAIRSSEASERQAITAEKALRISFGALCVAIAAIVMSITAMMRP